MYVLVDAKSSTPVYIQLKDQFRLAIAAGVLVPGEQLPTLRELAGELLINPNTVARAYRELQAEGLFTARTGSGTFVSDEAPALAHKQARREMADRLAELVRTARRLGLDERELRHLFSVALAQATAAPSTRKGDSST